MKVTQMGRMVKLPVLFLCVIILAAAPVFADPDAMAEPRAKRKTQKKILVVTYSQTGSDLGVWHV